MLVTIEALGGAAEQRRLIPLIPSDLPANQRERFITTAIGVLRRYTVITGKEAARRGIFSEELREAISIPTAEGDMYPTFQFDEAGRISHRVRVTASTSLRSGWERAEWWTTPNEAFEDQATPASLLGTRRENGELRDAIRFLFGREKI